MEDGKRGIFFEEESKARDGEVGDLGELAVEAPRFEKEKEAGLRRILSSQHHAHIYNAKKNKSQRKYSGAYFFRLSISWTSFFVSAWLGSSLSEALRISSASWIFPVL